MSGAYRWGDEIVLDPIPFKSAIDIAKAANGSRALEIRLLHQVGAQETVYSVNLSSFQSALRWQGSEDKRLLIRGQIEASEAGPRPLTWVVGRPWGKQSASWMAGACALHLNKVQQVRERLGKICSTSWQTS